MNLHRNSVAVLERREDLWINVYVEILLDSDPGIPVRDSLLDPIFEVFADDSVDDVAKPLLWDFWELSFVRKGPHDLRHFENAFIDQGALQTLILRHVEVLDLVTLDQLFEA